MAGTTCTCNCSVSNLTGEAKIEHLLELYKGNPSALIVVLSAIQTELGYLPKDWMVRVAEELNMPLTDVYGAATFYAAFSMQPKGKYTINLCVGTACYVKGAPEVQAAIEKELGIKPGETTEDRKFSFNLVHCIGACGIAPVMTINGDVCPKVTKDTVAEILSKYE
ncbi:MAG: NADH-quinone oxidoreductase subunit NuoE [Firmicutes bacterium]|nr:NADH-quinone oxidoreductase subunit NuoE [Bacillota bacterium]